MPIEFACPKCRKPLKVGDQFAGRPARCPTCKAAVTVPRPAAADPANPFAFTPAPMPPAAGAATENPFGFTPSPAPPADDADSGAPADPEMAERWDTPRRGLRLAWIGTVMFTGVPVAVLILALASNMLFGSIMLTETLFMPLDAAEGPSAQPPGFAVLLLRGAGLLLMAIMVLGPFFRILGFTHCVFLPLGAPGRVWALAMLTCELLTLGSFGLVFAAGYLPEVKSRLPLLEHLPDIGLLSMVAGIIFLLLHLRAVGGALQSKPLLLRVRNYVLWFGGSIVIYVLLAVSSQLLRSRGLTDLVFGLGTLSDMITCSAILVFLTAPIILLLKYMNLLDLAWDEIRKRSARWRPA